MRYLLQRPSSDSSNQFNRLSPITEGIQGTIDSPSRTTSGESVLSERHHALRNLFVVIGCELMKLPTTLETVIQEEILWDALDRLDVEKILSEGSRLISLLVQNLDEKQSAEIDRRWRDIQDILRASSIPSFISAQELERKLRYFVETHSRMSGELTFTFVGRFSFVSQVEDIFCLLCDMISNAIDAQKGAAEIKVSVRASPIIFKGKQMVHFSIRDWGPGMDCETLKGLGGGSTSKGEGRGRGFASDIAILRRIGGKVFVISTPKGSPNTHYLLDNGTVYSREIPLGEGRKVHRGTIVHLFIPATIPEQ